MILLRKKKERGELDCDSFFYYITEKSILVMIDPRPTYVPVEKGLRPLRKLAY